MPTTVKFENLQDFFSSDYYKSIKNDLIAYIAKEKGIKEESARRNINRMENYYKQTGKQSRSGKEYIPLIQKYLEAYENGLITEGATKVAVFPSYGKAKEYVGDLEHILPISYTTGFEPEVWRLRDTK